MNWKKFSLAWVVVFVLVLLLGFLIHGVLLSNQYEGLEGMVRPEEPDPPNRGSEAVCDTYVLPVPSSREPCAE